MEADRAADVGRLEEHDEAVLENDIDNMNDYDLEQGEEAYEKYNDLLCESHMADMDSFAGYA